MSALENPGTSGSTLTDLETRILDFERNWWRFAGAKETAIKELFDLTAPRYYQLLNDLIDRDDRDEVPRHQRCDLVIHVDTRANLNQTNRVHRRCLQSVPKLL